MAKSDQIAAALRIARRADGGDLASAGAVNGAARRLTAQGLYSHAAETAQRLPQESGTPQQFGSMLQKQGVKPAELANSGADWTDSKLKMQRGNLPKHFNQRLPRIQESWHLGRGLNAPHAVAAFREAHPRDRVIGPARYEGYTLPDGNNYRELLLHAPREPMSVDEGYESSHWNVPNVLAHLRMSEREDQSAPRDPFRAAHPSMLHLEELQSDWGQDARKHGTRKEADAAEFSPHWKQQLSEMRKTRGDEPFKDPVWESYFQKLHHHEWAVPYHPYIANTNAWVDLGLKRALLEAARGGHSRLAWTPGQEQADRYGLAKRFKAVEYSPQYGNLFGTERNNDVRQFKVSPEELPAHVGNELAQKLLATPQNQYGRHVLTGIDLQTGGEGMKAFYDKLVPQRLTDIVKKLGHQPEFEPTHARVWEGNEDGEEEPKDHPLHSLKITPELRQKILKGMPAFKGGGEVEPTAPDSTVDQALRVTARPAKVYAAGGSITKEPEYDTEQDGPFWRVARKGAGASGAAAAIEGATGTGARPDQAAGLGSAGSVGDGDSQSPEARRLAQLQGVADAFARRHGRGPVVDEGNSPSSLHKQSAIGRAFQLAATDDPAYKSAVFDAYRRRQPDVVAASGAHDYDSLRNAAYAQLRHEVKEQFDALPLKMSFHRHGEGDYETSKHMRHDVLHNGHLHVFQGGDKHSHLHHVDHKTKLSANEMFRAVHDAFGHALHGSGFGAQGEERAWNAHRQMFSPLATLAMSAETRGQNSFVNHTPLNAQLTANKHEIEAQMAHAKRFGRPEDLARLEKEKKEVMSGWQYAPQHGVLLPPEMLSPEYEGGMPDYVQKLVKPAKGTGFSSPVTHFSHESGLSELDPTRYGTGIPGDERSRVLKRPGAVKERTYGYLGAPGTVPPEPGLGAHAYQGQVNDLYNLSTDPAKLGLLAQEANRKSPLGNFNPGTVNQAQAMNDVERMAKEHGYSGVANPNAAYPMAAMFGKIPVKPASDDTVGRALALTRPPEG